MLHVFYYFLLFKQRGNSSPVLQASLFLNSHPHREQTGCVLRPLTSLHLDRGCELGWSEQPASPGAGISAPQSRSLFISEASTETLPNPALTLDLWVSTRDNGEIAFGEEQP